MKDSLLYLERQTIDLYKEKRNLELSNWRDTADIKRELREAQKEKRTFFQNSFDRFVDG